MSDRALVSALTLLFDGYTPKQIQTAVLEATALPLRDQRRLVCEVCGGDELWFDACAKWAATHARFEVEGDVMRVWCNTCEGETHDQEVAHDYAHPDLRDDRK